MTKPSVAALDGVFSALSDPTRRAIMERLVLGELSISELAFPFRMSLPAISKHLRVLEEAGLIVRRKQGRVHYCRLKAESLRAATDWLDRYRRFWEGQFDQLAEFLEATADDDEEEP